ncbi:hypothetical protein [Sphingomonas sp. 1185]|uniref:hypothetical protein n=1 Tax=Sphingomonas sp. 1185 TaxID=3156411 RepID=UPI0033919E39
MALSRPHDARVSLPFPSWAPASGGVMAWVATYALAMAIFFRTVIASGFDLGFGERGDALIEMTILEHWRNVLSGVSPWDAAFYFHPYGGSLGYNDGYFLYGLSYSVWRLVADPFHADTLNILTFKTIGFAAAYHLVKRTLGWGRGSALLVALLWSIASNIHLQAVHAQLQSVALLPVAMILAIGCVRAEGGGDRIAARWRAVALAALMAAWLLTSYYMAWFTIFSACLFVLCWAMLSGNARPTALAGLVRRHAGTLAWGGGAFAVLILPFLAVYLPKLRETGGEGYYEMLGYLVTPGIDMINVGPGNYLWGWLFRPLFALLHALFPDDPLLPGRVLGGEHEAGFPPLLCALLLVAAWRIVVRRRIGIAGETPVAWRAFALAMIVAWALTLQFWVASPWNLVFWLVPGAKGLRTVSRYQLWLSLPFLLIVLAAWREQAARLAATRPWWLAGIVALLVAENLSAETPNQISHAVHHDALAAIPAPPRDCAVFYVVATRVNEPLYINAELNALYPHNVDAMFLAERWRVPTINGFSTFNPPDWHFADPQAADYDARARAYVRAHGLRHVCRLDMRSARPWSRMAG